MAQRGIIAIGVWLFIIIGITQIQCLSPGYSYAKFMGPVSGPETKVAYYDDGKYHQHDYMAKPDYHFEYGVADPNSNVHQSRQETRHGDTVKGEYSVLDPDGKLRTVKYTADKKNGFHASIITDGHVVHHPQDPVQPVEGHFTPHIPPEQPHDDGGGGGDEDDYVEGDDEEDEEGGDDEDDEYSDSGVEGEEDEYY